MSYRPLPIILGSVLGGLVFISILILLYYLYRKYKTKNHEAPPITGMYKKYVDQRKKFTFYCTDNLSPEPVNYSLSPITPLPPIDLEENTERRIPVTASRFTEHF